MNFFTAAEDQFLRENYLTIPAKRMSVLLGRSESGARQRMAVLGIVVPVDIAEKFKRESRFKKTHTPFNKGRVQSDYMSASGVERSKQTRFQTGIIPKNLRPVGSERICTKDGYIMIKVSDPNKWRLKQRVIWEQHFGEKLKKGHIVCFKDGNKLNLSINNLEVITRQEGVKRNSFHKYSPEAKQTFRLIKKIKKAINEKQTNRSK